MLVFLMMFVSVLFVLLILIMDVYVLWLLVCVGSVLLVAVGVFGDGVVMYGVRDVVGIVGVGSYVVWRCWWCWLCWWYCGIVVAGVGIVGGVVVVGVVGFFVISHVDDVGVVRHVIGHIHGVGSCVVAIDVVVVVLLVLPLVMPSSVLVMSVMLLLLLLRL